MYLIFLVVLVISVNHLSINSVLVTLLCSTLLDCFVLKSLCSKTKQLRSVLVKLLVLNKCLNGLGFSGDFSQQETALLR